MGSVLFMKGARPRRWCGSSYVAAGRCFSECPTRTVSRRLRERTFARSTSTTYVRSLTVTEISRQTSGWCNTGYTLPVSIPGRWQVGDNAFSRALPRMTPHSCSTRNTSCGDWRLFSTLEAAPSESKSQDSPGAERTREEHRESVVSDKNRETLPPQAAGLRNEKSMTNSFHRERGNKKAQKNIQHPDARPQFGSGNGANDEKPRRRIHRRVQTGAKVKSERSEQGDGGYRTQLPVARLHYEELNERLRREQRFNSLVGMRAILQRLVEESAQFLTANHFNGCLEKLSKRKDVSGTKWVLKAMEECNICPNAITYRHLVLLYGNLAQLDKVEQLVEEAQQRGIVLVNSVKLLNTLIHVLGQNREFEKARVLFTRFDNTAVARGLVPLSQSAQLDRSTHCVEDISQEPGRSNSALSEASKKMMRRGKTPPTDNDERVNNQREAGVESLSPSPQTHREILSVYNTYLQCLALSGNAKEAEEIWRRLMNSQLQPDMFTYNAAINLYAKRGDFDTAEQIIEELKRVMNDAWDKKKGESPSPAQPVSSAESKVALGASSLPERWVKISAVGQATVVPSVLHYKTLLREMAKHEHMAERVERLLNSAMADFRESGPRRNPATPKFSRRRSPGGPPQDNHSIHHLFDELGRVYLETDQADKVDWIAGEICEGTFRPPPSLVSSIVDYYLAAGEASAADAVLRSLRNKNLGATFRDEFEDVLHAYAHRGNIAAMESLAQFLETSGPGVTLAAYASILKGYGKARMVDKAKRLVQRLEETGELLARRQKRKESNPRSVGNSGKKEDPGSSSEESSRNLRKQNREVGLVPRSSSATLIPLPDIFLYNSLLEVFYRSHLVGEAEALVAKLQRHSRVQPTRYTYHNLLMAYGGAGDCAKAERLFNEVFSGGEDRSAGSEQSEKADDAGMRRGHGRNPVDAKIQNIGETGSADGFQNEVQSGVSAAAQGPSEAAAQAGGGNSLLWPPPAKMQPNHVTFNIMLRLYCQAGDKDSAERLLFKMKARKLRPDGTSLSYLMQMYANFGVGEELVEDLLRQEQLGEEGNTN